MTLSPDMHSLRDEEIAGWRRELETKVVSPDTVFDWLMQHRHDPFALRWYVSGRLDNKLGPFVRDDQTAEDFLFRALYADSDLALGLRPVLNELVIGALKTKARVPRTDVLLQLVSFAGGAEPRLLGALLDAMQFTDWGDGDGAAVEGMVNSALMVLATSNPDEELRPRIVAVANARLDNEARLVRAVICLLTQRAQYAMRPPPIWFVETDRVFRYLERAFELAGPAQLTSLASLLTRSPKPMAWRVTGPMLKACESAGIESSELSLRPAAPPNAILAHRRKTWHSQAHPALIAYRN